MLPGDVGDVARVLTDLGIPLDVLPIDETAHKFAEVDEVTRKLLLELHSRQDVLARAGDHGGMQQLLTHIEHLRDLGEKLRSLASERNRLAAAGDSQEAVKFSARIQELEEVRLSIAAFYNTDFWIEQMSNGLSL